jgi:hypothetical protein
VVDFAFPYSARVLRIDERSVGLRVHRVIELVAFDRTRLLILFAGGSRATRFVGSMVRDTGGWSMSPGRTVCVCQVVSRGLCVPYRLSMWSADGPPSLGRQSDLDLADFPESQCLELCFCFATCLGLFLGLVGPL